MLIEKRLEGMTNRQVEFLEKLEKIIRKKWGRWARVYLEETNPKLLMPSGAVADFAYKNLVDALEVRRIENSVIIDIRSRTRLCQVRVEKTADDPVVLSNGFESTRIGRLMKWLMPLGLGIITLFPAILLLLVLLHWATGTPPPPEPWQMVVRYLLPYCVIVITLVIGYRKGHGSKNEQNVLNRFLKDCIKETIDSFKEGDQ